MLGSDARSTSALTVEKVKREIRKTFQSFRTFSLGVEQEYMRELCTILSWKLRYGGSNNAYTSSEAEQNI